MTEQRLTDTALIVGATMRLTRLIVTDDLGEWWVKEPIMRRLFPEGVAPMDKAKNIRRLGYFAGLNCPFCCGFWLGAGVLASHAVAKRLGLLRLWRFAAGALTLNEVAAHAGIRVGDFE